MSNVGDINFSNLISTQPSRFSTIQPALLPPMAVLQPISTEQIISNRMALLVQYWVNNDPPNAAQYDVGNLEFDPIRINQELNAFFEMMVRDRVNQAARAITLAYSVGTDLDAIGSRYPYGVPRLTKAAGTWTGPGTQETDEAYRQRLWMSPSILSLNGPGQAVYDSYVFWALSCPMPLISADGATPVPPIAHASAYTIPGTGQVYIPIMSGAMQITPLFPNATTPIASTLMIANPVPTAEQISTVYKYITAAGMARQGLTDVVNVLSPKVVGVNINVQYWLFPGVDIPAMQAEIVESVATLIQAIRWLGADLTILSLEGSLAIPGVYRTKLVSPTTDVIVSTAGCVQVLSVALTYMGEAE